MYGFIPTFSCALFSCRVYIYTIALSSSPSLCSKAVGQHLKSTYTQRGIQEARIHIHSTNYRRTQLSAQGLLDGLTSGNGGGVKVHVIPTDRDFLNGFESRADEVRVIREWFYISMYIKRCGMCVCTE